MVGQYFHRLTSSGSSHRKGWVPMLVSSSERAQDLSPFTFLSVRSQPYLDERCSLITNPSLCIALFGVN